MGLLSKKKDKKVEKSYDLPIMQYVKKPGDILVEIQLDGARELAKLKSLKSKADAYCCVYVSNEVQPREKSKVIKKTRNPSWKDTKTLYVSDYTKGGKSMSVRFEVYNYQGNSPHDFMGQATVYFNDHKELKTVSGKWIERWLPLEKRTSKDKVSGEIHVGIRCISTDANIKDLNKKQTPAEAEDYIGSGIENAPDDDELRAHKRSDENMNVPGNDGIDRMGDVTQGDNPIYNDSLAAIDAEGNTNAPKGRNQKVSKKPMIDPKRCKVTLDLDDGINAGDEQTFRIVPYNQFNELFAGGTEDEFKVDLRNPDGSFVAVDTVRDQDGSILCRFNPTQPGRHAIRATVNGTPITVTMDMPVNVLPFPDPSQSTVSIEPVQQRIGGRNNKANQMIKLDHVYVTDEPVMVLVDPVDFHGNHIADKVDADNDGIEIEIEAPDGSTIKPFVSLEEGEEGPYFAVEFTPKMIGKYKPNIRIANITLENVPLLEVNEPGIDPSKTEFLGLQTRADNDKPNSFTFQTRTANGDPRPVNEIPIIVTIEGDDINIDPAVDDPQAPKEKNRLPVYLDHIKDGLYRVSYVPHKVGNHKIKVQLGDDGILDHDVNVVEPADARHSIMRPNDELTELQKTQKGPHTKVFGYKIKARDINGNDLEFGGDPFETSLYEAKKNTPLCDELLRRMTDRPNTLKDNISIVPITVHLDDDEDKERLEDRLTPDTEFIEKIDIEDLENGSYVPLSLKQKLKPGVFIATIKLNDDLLPQAVVICISDEEKPDPRTCFADGPGTKKAYVNKPARVDVHARDSKGNPVTIPLDTEGDSPFDLELTGETDDPDKVKGTPAKVDPSETEESSVYPMQYIPTKEGIHRLLVKGCPFDSEQDGDTNDKEIFNKKIKVLNPDEAPDAAQTLVRPPLEELDPSLLHEPQQVIVYLHNSEGKPIRSEGDNVKLTVQTPNNETIPFYPTSDDLGDGSHRLTWVPMELGDHKLNIDVNGEPVYDKPVKVTVVDRMPALDEKPAELIMEDVKAAYKNGKITHRFFIIEAFDSEGDPFMQPREIREKEKEMRENENEDTNEEIKDVDGEEEEEEQEVDEDILSGDEEEEDEGMEFKVLFYRPKDEMEEEETEKEESNEEKEQQEQDVVSDSDEEQEENKPEEEEEENKQELEKEHKSEEEGKEETEYGILSNDVSTSLEYIGEGRFKVHYIVRKGGVFNIRVMLDNEDIRVLTCEL